MVTRGFILPPISEWLPVDTGSVNQTETELVAWETDLEAGLARARQEGKPVIIDTWATWCVNCRVLEKKTFGNPDVRAAMQRFVPLKIQLEKSGSPETKAFMQRFGLRQYSLPTTLLLNSSGEVKRILQGVVKPADMTAELNKVQ
jgi:thiol:disulfide interchange protein